MAYASQEWTCSGSTVEYSSFNIDISLISNSGLFMTRNEQLYDSHDIISYHCCPRATFYHTFVSSSKYILQHFCILVQTHLFFHETIVRYDSQLFVLHTPISWPSQSLDFETKVSILSSQLYFLSRLCSDHMRTDDWLTRSRMLILQSTYVWGRSRSFVFRA